LFRRASPPTLEGNILELRRSRAVAFFLWLGNRRGFASVHQNLAFELWGPPFCPFPCKSDRRIIVIFSLLPLDNILAKSTFVPAIATSQRGVSPSGLFLLLCRVVASLQFPHLVTLPSRRLRFDRAMYDPPPGWFLSGPVFSDWSLSVCLALTLHLGLSQGLFTSAVLSIFFASSFPFVSPSAPYRSDNPWVLRLSGASSPRISLSRHLDLGQETDEPVSRRARQVLKVS